MRVKPNFTPGPWTVETHDDAMSVETEPVYQTKCYGMIRKVIAVMQGDDADANARLIASAPDMYAALRLFIHLANNECINTANLPREYQSGVAAGLTHARAALAKAEGGDA